MTKQLDSNQLAEDYISAHLPFRGRSASQVLQADTVLNSIKICCKRSFLKCRLRCAYSCLDITHGLKSCGRSAKVSDSKVETLVQEKLKINNKWHNWKKLFHTKNGDVMSKKETNKNVQNPIPRRNAAIFIPDYEEEQTTVVSERKHSLELCDLEDSGHYDMAGDK